MSDDALKKIKATHDEAIRRIEEAVAWHKGEMAKVRKELEEERIAELKAKLTEEK